MNAQRGTHARVQPGFADPVHESQQAFRAALDALARPGRVQHVGAPLAGVALGGALARLLLALTDEDTPVWWQGADTESAQWLRFHTGARSVTEAAQARFAVVTDSVHLPALAGFHAGTADAPEQSCTVLVEVPALSGGPVLAAHGPGVADRQPLALAGLPPGFWADWQANHAAFPQGVDLFFTCGTDVIGLPRTSRIRRLEGV